MGKNIVWFKKFMTSFIYIYIYIYIKYYSKNILDRLGSTQVNQINLWFGSWDHNNQYNENMNKLWSSILNQSNMDKIKLKLKKYKKMTWVTCQTHNLWVIRPK
jgi:hypothetical protein